MFFYLLGHNCSNNKNKRPNGSIKMDIRFEALFNSASLGIIVVDKNGINVLSNHFTNKLFG